MDTITILLNERYRITYSKEFLLGKGSFGIVVKGIDTKNNNTPVAVKHLSIEEMAKDGGGEYMVNALKKELEILKIVDCPYSTRPIDWFLSKDYIYIVMELCDGDLDEELIKRNQPFDVKTVKKIMNQLNQAFYIMYENKIMHRDLKLQNIFIKYTNPSKTEFDVKLGDYGFSTVSEDDVTKTLVGTPITMAPEVFDGELYSSKADLWSIGIIIHMLHFAKLPFPFLNPLQYRLTLEIFKPNFKSEDPDLNNLLSRLIQPRVEDRISWEEYFKHPFFNGATYRSGPKQPMNTKQKWTSVLHSAEGHHKPNPQPPIKIPSQNVPAKVNPKPVSQPKPNSSPQIPVSSPQVAKYVITNGDIIHKIEEEKTYVCCKAKISKPKETVIVKDYSTNIIIYDTDSRLYGTDNTGHCRLGGSNTSCVVFHTRSIVAGGNGDHTDDSSACG